MRLFAKIRGSAATGTLEPAGGVIGEQSHPPRHTSQGVGLRLELELGLWIPANYPLFGIAGEIPGAVAITGTEQDEPWTISEPSQ
jgi:hypothetical protein